MSDVTYADVIRTVNGMLKEAYPEITRYGNDTVDKAVPPYFFVECIPVGINRQTRNMMNKSCRVIITYVQKVSDQVDNLTKAERLGEKLGMNIRINERKLQVLRYSHEYIGEKANILQISFALNWWESTEEKPTEEIMQHLHTELIEKGE